MNVSKTFTGQLVVSFAIIRYCVCATNILKLSQHPAPSRRLSNPIRRVSDVSLLGCCALCTDTSVCTAVNYRAETGSCELVGATWKENIWDENNGWKVYRNVNVCDFTEYPGILLNGYDGSVYPETEVDDCKMYCWHKNDDCLSFDYDISISKCFCNTQSTMEAIDAGALRNSSNWALYTKDCEPQNVFNQLQP